MTDDNVPDPREAEAADWSARQWEQWFRDEVMSHSEWRVVEGRWDDAEQEFEVTSFYDQYRGREVLDSAEKNFAWDPLTGEVDADLLSGLRALAGTMDKGIDVYAALLGESWEHAFARISPERRMRFFRGWNRVVAHDAEAAIGTVARGAIREAASAAAAVDSVADAAADSLGLDAGDPGADPRSGWSRSQYWVNITLPNGNVATVPTGGGPSTPGAGDFEVPEVTITEPTPASAPPPSAPEPPARPERPAPDAHSPATPHSTSFAPFGIAPFTAGCFAAVIGGLVALAVVAVLAVNLFGGGDDGIAVPADADGGAASDAATSEATSVLGTSAGGGPTERGVEIEVIEIDGEHFYRYIFDLLGSPASGRYSCGADEYATHLGPHPFARSFQNPHIAVSDPDPTGCGFGKTIDFTTNNQVVDANSALDPDFARLRFSARVIGEWCFYTLADMEDAGTSNAAVENLCSRNPRQTD